MFVANIATSVTIGGASFSGSVQKIAEGSIGQDLQLPAAEAGSLTTRTDNDTGVVTVGNAGHGITTSDKVDVYWSGGKRGGMSVTNVTGTAITVDLGAGTNLPSQGVAVTIAKQQTIDMDVDSALLEVLAVACTKRTRFEFQTAASASIAIVELDTGGGVWSWVNGQGFTNPVTGQVVGKLLASCGETAVATFQVGVLYQSN